MTSHAEAGKKARAKSAALICRQQQHRGRIWLLPDARQQPTNAGHAKTRALKCNVHTAVGVTCSQLRSMSVMRTLGRVSAKAANAAFSLKGRKREINRQYSRQNRVSIDRTAGNGQGPRKGVRGGKSNPTKPKENQREPKRTKENQREEQLDETFLYSSLPPSLLSFVTRGPRAQG